MWGIAQLTADSVFYTLLIVLLILITTVILIFVAKRSGQSIAVGVDKSDGRTAVSIAVGDKKGDKNTDDSSSSGSKDGIPPPFPQVGLPKVPGLNQITEHRFFHSTVFRYTSETCSFRLYENAIEHGIKSDNPCVVEFKKLIAT